jgi:hypothetical protein
MGRAPSAADGPLLRDDFETASNCSPLRLVACRASAICVFDEKTPNYFNSWSLAPFFVTAPSRSSARAFPARKVVDLNRECVHGFLGPADGRQQRVVGSEPAPAHPLFEPVEIPQRRLQLAFKRSGLVWR